MLLGQLLLDFRLRFRVSAVLPTAVFVFSSLQHDNEDDGKRDYPADVEPKIVFFLFHDHFSQLKLLFLKVKTTLCEMTSRLSLISSASHDEQCQITRIKISKIIDLNQTICFSLPINFAGAYQAPFSPAAAIARQPLQAVVLLQRCCGNAGKIGAVLRETPSLAS